MLVKNESPATNKSKIRWGKQNHPLLKLLTFILYLTFIGYYARGQHKVTGHYVTNLAESGWFTTQIQLNKDQTFKYQFKGDLSNDLAHGTFTINGDTIKLNYETHASIELTPQIAGDSAEFKSYFPNLSELNRPQELLYKNGKLWFLNEKGQIKRTALGYRRQFLIFGPRKLVKRIFYLKPVNYEWKNW